MRKRQKGFTVVELIVSFSLTLVVILLLFQVIISLKELYVKDGVKTELMAKQSIMTQKIMDDFDRKKMETATRCGDDCLNFSFSDNTTSQLTIDRAKGVFHYGDYTTKLVGDSDFGTIHIGNQTTLNVAKGKKDSMIQIEIPIHNRNLKGDYGVKVVYQYDSRTTSIGDLNSNQEITGKEQIFLYGLKEMALIEGETYEEPGYYLKREDGSMVANDSRVTVTGSVGTANGTYTLTYTLKNTSGATVSTITRTVKRIARVYNFDYTGAAQTFTTPVNGIYRVQLWGAAGGSAVGVLGGNGAYTTGQISLDKSTVLYPYVGEYYNGYKETKSFNGGGHGTYSIKGDSKAANGGGATDIRLTNGTWDNIESLRSRIMVAAGGAGGGWWDSRLLPGGAGGALAGHPGTVDRNVEATTVLNPATGGTQTAGGTGYNGNANYAGSFGVGGNNPEYVMDWNYGSGGGGGYYGGGAGSALSATVGSGAGGSSFISGYPGCNAVYGTGAISGTGQPNHYSGKIFSNANMIDGVNSMPNPRGSGNIIGNPGHGYARITVLAITN